MSRYLTKRDISILLGNVLDHFDTTLYGFLAPILAPLFFPNHDPVMQLILAYSVLATSIITKPIGTFVFGLIAQRHSPMLVLSYSLIGVAITTMLIGCLPTALHVGWLAPLLLIIIRMLRGVFATAETTIAKLYIMENKPEAQARKASYWYQSSTMLGYILASALATVVIALYPTYNLWRWCFWLGGVTGLMGYALRRTDPSIHPPSPKASEDTQGERISAARGECFNNPDCPEEAQRAVSRGPCGTNQHPLANYTSAQLKLIWQERTNILRVGIIKGLSYVTYAVPFVFMNTFIPLITKHSAKSMMIFNTAFLVLDMLLIPVLGQLTLRWKTSHVMKTASLVLAVTMPPLFYFLPNSSLAYISFVRIWIVWWGVLYMCPQTFWCRSLFKPSEQYLMVGMGRSIGSTTIGRMTTAICLWLWYVTGITVAPAFYIMIVALGATWAIMGKKETSI